MTYSKLWGLIPRCDSCGLVVLGADQSAHSEFHARLDQIAELATQPLVEAGRLSINDQRRLTGLIELDGFSGAPK